MKVRILILLLIFPIYIQAQIVFDDNSLSGIGNEIFELPVPNSDRFDWFKTD